MDGVTSVGYTGQSIYVMRKITCTGHVFIVMPAWIGLISTRSIGCCSASCRWSINQCRTLCPRSLPRWTSALPLLRSGYADMTMKISRQYTVYSILTVYCIQYTVYEYAHSIPHGVSAGLQSNDEGAKAMMRVPHTL